MRRYSRMMAGSGSMAAGGEGDGGGQNQRAAGPGVGAEVFAEQLDAEPGAERRLDVEEDAGARGGHMMDAPVPEQRGGGRAEQAADGQRGPCGGADVGEGQRRGVLMGERGSAARAPEPRRPA